MKADLHSFYFDPDLGIIAALKGDPDQGYLVGLFDSRSLGYHIQRLLAAEKDVTELVRIKNMMDIRIPYGLPDLNDYSYDVVMESDYVHPGQVSMTL